MNLPSETERIERLERARTQIEAFAAQRDGDPLLWCHLPHLFSRGNSIRRPYRVPVPLSRADARRLRGAQLSRRRTPPRGVSADLGDGALFTGAPIVRRSQASLVKRFGPLAPRSASIGSAYWPTRRLIGQASELVSDLIAFGQARRVELPDTVTLHRAFLRTARLLAGWEGFLARERPRVVIAGNVWTSSTRALLHAARRAGVPSVYVPHCPVPSNVRLMDLGVDYVALRGVAEADFLVSHGVDGDRLDVVGNPSIAPEPPPDIDATLPVVFAPSNENLLVLRPLIELIGEALGDQVVVGRHPKARPERASQFPGSWLVHTGRTRDLLRSGPPAVLQRASGVTVECMHLGIRVIELCFPGQAPSYPVIHEPHVRFVSSSQELREAVASIRAYASDPSRREQLIDWARQWSWPNGSEAGERLVALVDRAITAGPRGPISPRAEERSGASASVRDKAGQRRQAAGRTRR